MLEPGGEEKILEELDLTLGIVSGLISVFGVGFVAYRYWARKRAALSMQSAVRRAERMLEAMQRDRFAPAAVLGLGRSGALWGGWFAGNLGSLPIHVVNRHFEVTQTGRRVVLEECEPLLRQLRRKYGDGASFLVVEGATTTGNAFLDFETCLARAYPTADVRTASLYVQTGTIRVPDYAGDEALAPWPEKFPWHHSPAYKRFLHGNRP